MADYNRSFAAEESDLPPLAGPADQQHLTLLTRVWYFFQQTSMKGQPPVSFDALGVPPHTVHAWVGDIVWKGYWGANHGTISGANCIPKNMMDILKHIVNVKHEEFSMEKTAELEKEVKAEYSKASTQHATRIQERGSPY